MTFFYCSFYYLLLHSFLGPFLQAQTHGQRTMNSLDHAVVSAAIPPDGVLPNFVNPTTRDTEMYVGIGVCIGLTLIFVPLRLYVKLVVTHMWGWDDGAYSCESIQD